VIGGRGFIAIAIVILGRWQLAGVVIAAVAIGFTDALRLRLSSIVEFPVDILAMLPWIVVLVMLTLGARKERMPRALGRNLGGTATS
jgi:simple sugar transport system permease protein